MSSVLIRESNPLEFAKQCEDDAKYWRFIYSQEWEGRDGNMTRAVRLSVGDTSREVTSDTDKRIRQIVKETFCSNNNNSTFVEDEKEEDENEFYIRNVKKRWKGVGIDTKLHFRSR